MRSVLRNPVGALLAVAMILSTAHLAAKTPQKHVEIIAHRGESYDAPENTLAAINLAWQRGAPAVEFDVHLTSDGKLISIHDKDTYRVTGGDKGGGKKLAVVEHTAEDLQKLDVGTWKDLKYARERMPLIDDVLATIPPDRHRRLFIEIKVGPESVEPLAAALKRAGKPAEQTPVISFNLDTCREVKKQLPELQVYYLAHFNEDKKTKQPPPTIDELIRRAKDANLDGLDLSFKGPIDAASVKSIHDAGLQCYVWTVDDPAVARRMIEAGVEGITTNRAQWLSEQLGIPTAEGK